MRRVEKWSLAYESLRIVARLIYRFTYRNITIRGIKNVPAKKPVIFAPNHQNALDAPMAIVGTSSAFQPVFLARADIFKNKIVARILNFLKISPVYRLRDGKDSLEKNKEVFDNSVRILANNKILCLFPEAKHVGMKSMLPHKKAIPRIVFIAAQQTNFEMDIQIVPVGINYSHYYNFRRSLVLNYGKPISSLKYYPIYKEKGESMASSALRDDLFEAIKELVVHVPDKHWYELYSQAFEMAGPEACKKLGLRNYSKYFYDAEKLLTQKIENYFSANEDLCDEWQQKAKAYFNLKGKFNFNEQDLRFVDLSIFKTIFMAVLAVLLIPVGLLGAVAHGWLFYLTRYPYRKMIKDKQFYSSVSYVLSLLLYPLWTIGLFFILYSIFSNPLIALGLLVFSYPSGLIAWESAQIFNRLRKNLLFVFGLKRNNISKMKLLNLRNDLQELYRKILDQ
jgi:1-acyl-sn-glycerol-3-phosphate acyltransferase